MGLFGFVNRVTSDSMKFIKFGIMFLTYVAFQRMQLEMADDIRILREADRPTAYLHTGFLDQP